MQFWPRKRSKKAAPKVRSWPITKDTKLLGFVGYKVGMTHYFIKDNNPNSLTKGEEISEPATVIECPPLKVYSIRFYKQTPEGLEVISEIFSKKTDKELVRKIKPCKNDNSPPEAFDDLKLVVYTVPKKTCIGKKKPDLVELGIGGKDMKAKQEYAESLLDKDIAIADIIKPGELVDIHSITKGKGTQGPVKRFGVKIRQHKSEKTKRGPGTLGDWRSQGKIMYRVAHAGKTGYNLRTDYNKTAVLIGNNPDEVNPKGGFVRYGLVKNDYILIKGSVPGAAKRAVTMTAPIRQPPKFKSQLPEVTHVSQASKQGM